MEDIASSADDIYRRRVLAAREMDPLEKFLAGPRLFDIVCQRMIYGIEMQRPEATAEEVRAELRRRLQLAGQLEGAHGQ